MARGMPDPWTLAQSFINDLNDQAAKNRYYGNTAENAMYKAMIDRQDAELLNTQKLAKDEGDFQQQLLRDEAQREFYHNENWLQSQYKNEGAGSKSRFAKPQAATTAPNVPPPYQSPLRSTSSVQPATAPQQQQQVPDTGGEPELSQKGAYSYYIQQGVPPVVAAGIVANLEAESSFDPAVWSGQRRGDNGSAGYAGQWRGSRQQGLLNFAAQRGHAQPTVKDQLDFYVYEGTSGQDEGAKRAFELAANAQSPEEAAQIIMTHFERPSADPRENQIGHRQRTARQIFESGGGSSGGQQQPATTQRRYPMPMEGQPGSTVQPETPYPVETSKPKADTTIDDEEHVWTDEELNQYLAPDEVAAIKNKGQNVVGPPRIYTELAVENLPSEIKDHLMPVFKNEQYGPSEWLYLADPQPEMTEDGVTVEAKPQITTAPPVTITKPNEKDPEDTESVKQVNGVWYTKIDDKWVRME